MKKTVLVFGLIGGVVISALMLGSIPFAKKIGFDKSQFVGYTVMVLSFLMVFFGIRSYRENIGTISFGRAFAVGALITLIASVCYVLTWEIMYFKLTPNFLNEYSNYMVEKLRTSGASQQVIDAKLEQMKQFKQMCDNPLINAAITFLEPLPCRAPHHSDLFACTEKERDWPLTIQGTGATDGCLKRELGAKGVSAALAVALSLPSPFGKAGVEGLHARCDLLTGLGTVPRAVATGIRIQPTIE